MDFNPFTETNNFVDLLSSQQNLVFGTETSPQVPFYGNQATEDSNFGAETQGTRKERIAWSPGDDVLLISSWLNTSKDAVVGNEQRFNTFWTRIAAYYNVSPQAAGSEKREPRHCKNRWQKINDLKWCEVSTAKTDGNSKKRKCGDVSQSASSKAIEEDSGDDDEVTTRPPGVKAAKARSKKTMDDGKKLSQFQTMWSLKQQDLVFKERLSKNKLLDSLIAKQGPLADKEEALKKKLINELMSN
ncbi:PREDICTED: uncharacterized protein LOC106330851 [Brassica oleracea var. oleracea]|uniref:uncharacterized protein LOC106330851 n=1 Tax=Brassica oleracea var. oleracea TaxID=109376 RepID=UPI0006A6E50F|nr:PREDICTED: uncharacterized protein LOC106330851 [Brassica oleracea var. oleracea]